MQVLLKLTNFKFVLIFWKYNSNILTYIFNLARRQIRKKWCRPFKNWHFFWQIWAKMTKNAIFWHKNGQKYHFRIGFMKQSSCQMQSIYANNEFSEKIFLKLSHFSTHYNPLKCIYKTYILRLFWSYKNFNMKLSNFKFFYIFSNFCTCCLTSFRNFQGDKKSLRYVHLNFSTKNSQFLYTKTYKMVLFQTGKLYFKTKNMVGNGNLCYFTSFSSKIVKRVNGIW